MEKESGRSVYWVRGHTTSRLRYHIVFTPKYRRRVLDGRLAERLEQLFREACAVHCWELSELSIQPDHVHMLLQLPPKNSVSDAMQYLKGGTARIIRQEFPSLEEHLWGASLWSDGYFAETVGHVDELVVTNYIRNQEAL